MEAEKLKEEAESARIEAEAAALRYQRLLSMLQESREEEERAAQAKRDQDSAVIHAAEILYEARDNIRRGSQGNVYRIRAALDLLPPGTVNSDDIRILFRSGKEAPSMENILDFLQSHI